jgi:Carboxypeptidase regulatory-like domain/TonB dependent receptor
MKSDAGTETVSAFRSAGHKNVALCLALLIFAMLAPQVVTAQAVYGSVFGTVTDSTGAVVPNATVTVTDTTKGTSVSVQSDASGEYRVQHLIPDTYNVTAEATGFSKVTTANIVVYADTAPKVDISLSVGSASNTVTVSAEAPLLQTEHTDVNTILNERAVETLPNLNRNFTAFELLTPGTTYIGWGVDESQNPQRSQQIEVDGQLPFATGYELDGTDNQDPVIGIAVINPNLDAVSEMKVTSQNYDAEFGKAVAGLVTAQTKSGSNSLHGSAFEFRRSDAQQARDPFSESTPNDITGKFIPTNLHNQFGGSVGGPIIKNKLFFFGDYQGLREKSGIANLFTVPTAQARSTCLAAAANPALTCDLSEYPFQIYNPGADTTGLGRSPFVGNQIPGSLLSTPAINLLSLIPAPNHGAAGLLTNNYAASGTGSFHTNQFDVRVDDQFSDKMHLFGRYTFFDSSLNGGSVFGPAGGSGFGTNGFAGTDTSKDHSLTAGGDYTLSSKWLTDFRFGWFRFHFNELQPGFNQPLGTELGIPGVNTGNLALNGGLPAFAIDGFTQNNTNFGTNTAPFLLTENSYQINNNWSHSVGHHNIKFGVDVRRATLYAVGLDNNNFRSGNFHFPSTITGAAAAFPGDPNASPGVGLATFLLGDVGPFQRTQTQNTSAATHQWRAFYYAQDQWRATNTLTISYGLRWEWYFPEAADGKGQGGLLDLNTSNVRIAGYGPYDDSLNVSRSWKKLAPRIGISWQARPNTVVRAGFGRVYGQGWSGNTFGEVLTFTYPVQVSQNLTPSTQYTTSKYLDGTPVTLSNGPPAYIFAPIPASGNYPLPDGVGVPTRPLEVRLPTLDAWNLTIQQEINKSTALQIAYVGSHGVHNMFDSSNQFDPNQATINGFNQIDPTTGQTYTYNDRQPFFNGDAQALFGVKYGHPFFWTQGFRYNANQATSSYNALQVKLEKRFSHGFQFLSHYTWSRAMTHESYYFAIDPKVGYGASYYNRPNAFVLAGNWDLPFGKGKAVGGNSPRALDYLIGGYSLNGTVTVESGLPYTPRFANCSAINDLGVCAPNAIGSDFHLGAGSFDPVTDSVPYFTPSPYSLGSNNCGATLNQPCPTTFGPYALPAVGTFGNIHRDSLNGPGLVNTDLSVAKKFAIRESVSLQFRADAFNLFNKVNLGQPNNCIDCGPGSGSGLITSTIGSQDGTSMRRLQFALRVEF